MKEKIKNESLDAAENIDSINETEEDSATKEAISYVKKYCKKYFDNRENSLVPYYTPEFDENDKDLHTVHFHKFSQIPYRLENHYAAFAISRYVLMLAKESKEKDGYRDNESIVEYPIYCTCCGSELNKFTKYRVVDIDNTIEENIFNKYYKEFTVKEGDKEFVYDYHNCDNCVNTIKENLIKIGIDNKDLVKNQALVYIYDYYAELLGFEVKSNIPELDTRIIYPTDKVYIGKKGNKDTVYNVSLFDMADTVAHILETHMEENKDSKHRNLLDWFTSVESDEAMKDILKDKLNMSDFFEEIELEEENEVKEESVEKQETKSLEINTSITAEILPDDAEVKSFDDVESSILPINESISISIEDMTEEEIVEENELRGDVYAKSMADYMCGKQELPPPPLVYVEDELAAKKSKQKSEPIPEPIPEPVEETVSEPLIGGMTAEEIAEENELRGDVYAKSMADYMCGKQELPPPPLVYVEDEIAANESKKKSGLKANRNTGKIKTFGMTLEERDDFIDNEPVLDKVLLEEIFIKQRAKGYSKDFIIESGLYIYVDKKKAEAEAKAKNKPAVQVKDYMADTEEEKYDASIQSEAEKEMKSSLEKNSNATPVIDDKVMKQKTSYNFDDVESTHPLLEQKPLIEEFKNSIFYPFFQSILKNSLDNSKYTVICGKRTNFIPMIDCDNGCRLVLIDTQKDPLNPVYPGCNLGKLASSDIPFSYSKHGKDFNVDYLFSTELKHKPDACVKNAVKLFNYQNYDKRHIITLGGKFIMTYTTDNHQVEAFEKSEAVASVSKVRTHSVGIIALVNDYKNRKRYLEDKRNPKTRYTDNSILYNSSKVMVCSARYIRTKELDSNTNSEYYKYTITEYNELKSFMITDGLEAILSAIIREHLTSKLSQYQMYFEFEYDPTLLVSPIIRNKLSQPDKFGMSLLPFENNGSRASYILAYIKNNAASITKAGDPNESGRPDFRYFTTSEKTIKSFLRRYYPNTDGLQLDSMGSRATILKQLGYINYKCPAVFVYGFDPNYIDYITNHPLTSGYDHHIIKLDNMNELYNDMAALNSADEATTLAIQKDLLDYFARTESSHNDRRENYNYRESASDNKFRNALGL